MNSFLHTILEHAAPRATHMAQSLHTRHTASHTTRYRVPIILHPAWVISEVPVSLKARVYALLSLATGMSGRELRDFWGCQGGWVAGNWELGLAMGNCQLGRRIRNQKRPDRICSFALSSDPVGDRKGGEGEWWMGWQGGGG